MFDLYNKAEAIEIEKKLGEIHGFPCANQKIAKLQNIINTYLNLEIYESIRKSTGDLLKVKNRINRLFQELIEYIDIEHNDFISSFAGNHNSRVFELVMGKFIKDNGGKLKKNISTKNNSKPDWIFEKNGTEYSLECTTRNSSRMDKFYEYIPDLIIYSKIANVFLEKNEELRIIDSAVDVWYEWIEHLSENFDNRQWIKIITLLNTDDKNLALKKIQSWIYHMRYATAYFPTLIPRKALKELEKYDLSNPDTLKNDGFGNSCTNGPIEISQIKKFNWNSIAKMICNKLEKSYSKTKTPIIFAISLATLQDQLIHPTDSLSLDFNEAVAQSLLSEILKVQEKSMENVYAIILNTTCDNWFPDIDIKYYGAKFPKHYSNCFSIIYNQKLINEYGRLFENIIPYQQTIHF